MELMLLNPLGICTNGRKSRVAAAWLASEKRLELSPSKSCEAAAASRVKTMANPIEISPMRTDSDAFEVLSRWSPVYAVQLNR